jgi:hypothetical protein
MSMGSVICPLDITLAVLNIISIPPQSSQVSRVYPTYIVTESGKNASSKGDLAVIFQFFLLLPPPALAYGRTAPSLLSCCMALRWRSGGSPAALQRLSLSGTLALDKRTIQLYVAYFEKAQDADTHGLLELNREAFIVFARSIADTSADIID